MPQLIDFLSNHRNTKVRMILVCLMGRGYDEVEKRPEETRAFYFQTKTHINIESTDVRVILFQMMRHIKN